jgi:deoxycytidylate deaminase
MQEKSLSGSQYDNCIAQHAEAGALLWSDVSLRQGATLVVNGSPCMGCAKLIASSGIYRIVYIRDESYAEVGKVEEFLSSLGIELVSLECICSSCTAKYNE